MYYVKQKSTLPESERKNHTMGMAASQARYLALTARKTNVEYEGQQINQSRLLLANQTADLFNQMLGMTVPTAPSSSEFSKLQYSYSDGLNSSVIENFYQIGNANEDYNYVVTSYHMEKIYTGSRKLLSDPQVQAQKTDKYSYDPTINQKHIGVKAILTPSQTGNGSYIITDTNSVTHTFRPVDNTNSADRMKLNAISGTQYSVDDFSYDTANDTYSYTTISKHLKSSGVETNTFTKNGNNYDKDGVSYAPIDLADLDNDSQVYKNLYSIYGSAFESDVVKAKNGETVDNTYYSGNDGTKINFAKNIDKTNAKTDIYEITNDTTEYTRVDTSNVADEEELIKVFGSNYDKSDAYYVHNSGTADDPVYEYLAASDIINGKSSVDHKNRTVTVSNASDVYYTDGNGNYVLQSEIFLMTVGSTLVVQQAEYTPTFSNYTAVGNSTLTQVTADDYKKDKTISTEIQQIIKDMKGVNGSPLAAENFAKCFDEAGDYIGGIYSFKMGGTTYYTTEMDLEKSISSAYTSDALADNGIDSQQSKLAYYNAVYLDTKVEETKKALLETDGQGRFKTVKFEDDSTVYTLNVETINDDAAYEDAMNQYYYDQDVYDKAIRDINAKTEIIQAQDRTLELRLEQLNTEQSALQNEMEAVKKVVDKHVEQGFKTFGG